MRAPGKGRTRKPAGDEQATLPRTPPRDENSRLAGLSLASIASKQKIAGNKAGALLLRTGGQASALWRQQGENVEEYLERVQSVLADVVKECGGDIDFYDQHWGRAPLKELPGWSNFTHSAYSLFQYAGARLDELRAQSLGSADAFLHGLTFAELVAQLIDDAEVELARRSAIATRNKRIEPRVDLILEKAAELRCTITEVRSDKGLLAEVREVWRTSYPGLHRSQFKHDLDKAAAKELAESAF